MAKSKPHGLASIKPKRYVTGGEIIGIYDDLFGRRPDDEGLAYWSDALKGKTRAEAYALIGGAAKNEDVAAVDDAEVAEKAIKAAYEEQLGRKADAQGLKYYTDKVLAGEADINRISAELDRSTEGYNYDAERLVSSYRQNFGRNPDQEGFQYWMGEEDKASSGIGALSDAFRSAASGTDIAAAAAAPQGGYSSMDLEALRADPYAGLYANQNPYLFDLTQEQQDQMANVSRTQAGQYIQFTNPVTGRPVISRVNDDGSYTTISGDDVLQAANVRGAMDLALSSGALTQKKYDDIQAKILNARPGTTVPWDEIYSTLSAPQARVILNNMGIQIGEDADPVKALAESSARNELVTQSIIQGGLNLGTIPSTRFIGQYATETSQEYPFTQEAMQRAVPRNVFTMADVANNVGTRLGNVAPVTRQSLTPEFFTPPTTPTVPGGTGTDTVTPAGPTPLPRLETYANRALLGEDAPGFAPAVFGIPQQVNQLYRDVLNRPADPEGMAYWTGAVGRAISPQEMAAFRAAAAPELAGGQYGADRPYTGGIAYIPSAAPLPFPGVPAAAARPAVNLAPTSPTAQDIAGEIGAARGVGKAEGGLATLAERVQDAGRGDDTMLVHMTPNEVAGLQALAMQMGGSGTINPVTGLPEFGWLDKAWKNFLKPVRKVARGLGPIGTIIGSYFGGPIGAALVAGLQNKEKTFDFGRAATAAAASYIGGKIVSGMGGMTGGTPPVGGEVVGDAIGGSSGVTVTPIPPSGGEFMTPAVSAAPAAPISDISFPSGSVPAGAPPDLGSAVLDIAKEGAKAVGIDTPAKAIFAGTQAVSAIKGYQDQKNYEEDYARALADEEERRRLQREQAYATMRANPINFGAAGGVMQTDELGEDEEEERQFSLAAGGLKEGSFIVPADVVAHLGNGSTDAGLKALARKYGAKPIKGPGDGMSDSIPTHIEGKQRARVADGEAIIEPMVTQKVGAKNLYAMMDKVRKARTGTTKQGKEINPMRYMPA
jgi:hypothetical protein